MEHGAALRELVRHPSTRQYDCTAKAPARGKRPAGFAGGKWGVCMKTILVPTEHNSAMASALDTALLLAQKFGSCIEGFPLRPAVADLVAMDPDTFSVAAYTGKYGWVRVRLAGVPLELADRLLTSAWRRTAPKRLVAKLEDSL